MLVNILADILHLHQFFVRTESMLPGVVFTTSQLIVLFCVLLFYTCLLYNNHNWNKKKNSEKNTIILSNTLATIQLMYEPPHVWTVRSLIVLFPNKTAFCRHNKLILLTQRFDVDVNSVCRQTYIPTYQYIDII